MTDFHHEHPNFDCPFEISPFTCKLTGGLRATIYEDGQKGPQEIITTDNNWTIDVEWFLHGHLTRHLCGTFCIGVHLESVGEGPEKSLGTFEVPMEPCGNGHYRYEVKVPAGTVPSADCGRLYIVAITLTSKDACGKPGHINAFCKEGCVMIAEPAAP